MKLALCALIFSAGIALSLTQSAAPLTTAASPPAPTPPAPAASAASGVAARIAQPKKDEVDNNSNDSCKSETPGIGYMKHNEHKRHPSKCALLLCRKGIVFVVQCEKEIKSSKQRYPRCCENSHTWL